MATLTPLDAVTAERTFSPSATTSGPMPSPPITAMFRTSVCCASTMFTSVGAVLHCGFPISRYEQHPWETAPDGPDAVGQPSLEPMRLCGLGPAGPVTPAARGAQPVRLRSCDSLPPPTVRRPMCLQDYGDALAQGNKFLAR